MTSTLPGARRSLMLLAAGALMAMPAAAQDRNDASGRPSNLPPGAVVQPLDNGMGEELRRHVAALAENPRSISALIGAGRAALAMGDPQAALTFFSRADEIDGRDARAKAGMAAAFARLERGQPALDLFAEAVALGAPETEIAGDRGLAYDTIGDPARAQRDYATALRHRDDPEIRRRLAISLAISGQRDAALRVIDGQLREQGRAAWRTQAFVLALTGDQAGASRIVERMMPPQAASRMAPFLAQLPGLNPAQKALAAHFGHFPGNGGTAIASAADARADPDALALAQNGIPATARSRNPEPVSTASRRRPGAAVTTEEREGIGLRPQPPSTRDRLEERRRQQTEIAQLETRRAAGPAAPPPQSATPPPQTITNPPASTRFQPNTPSENMPGFSLTPGGPQPSAAASAAPSPSAPPPIVPVQTRPFADIAAVVNDLPQDMSPPAPAPQRPAAPPAAEPARPAPQRAQRQRPAQPAHPSRHWVQIAGGANKATLPREFARLRGLAPDLLGRQQAWTTPLNATNRLLVGPFPSAREAQAFVNRLAGQSLSAFAWTSPQGQEIERLQTR